MWNTTHGEYKIFNSQKHIVPDYCLGHMLCDNLQKKKVFTECSYYSFNIKNNLKANTFEKTIENFHNFVFYVSNFLFVYSID